MIKTEFALQQQKLTLYRFPKRANEALQAWDAGDEYIINHFVENPLEPSKHILILNDNFGALSGWFSKDYKVTMMSDSHISHHGTLKNLQRNQCNKIDFLKSTDAIPNDVDMVMMQIPKNNRFLTWQLHQLRSALPSSVPVIAVNKANDIHSSTLKLFEDYLGETTTSLAWKKHRLVFCRATSNSIKPVSAQTCWDVPEHDMNLSNLANVYSGESLDLGARFMLEHLPSDCKIQNIVDLGCGNGVLSVKVGRLNPQANITCVDESFMAIESARININKNVSNPERFTFKANNCLDGFASASQDLVMCNPPFHQQNAITDHIAWQMFNDAKKVLKENGQLLVIGNRHLSYPSKLAKLFGRSNIEVVASNSKFIIVAANKAPRKSIN